MEWCITRMAGSDTHGERTSENSTFTSDGCAIYSVVRSTAGPHNHRTMSVCVSPMFMMLSFSGLKNSQS